MSINCDSRKPSLFSDAVFPPFFYSVFFAVKAKKQYGCDTKPTNPHKHIKVSYFMNIAFLLHISAILLSILREMYIAKDGYI
jgi:hypothetical protein